MILTGSLIQAAFCFMRARSANLLEDELLPWEGATPLYDHELIQTAKNPVSGDFWG